MPLYAESEKQKERQAFVHQEVEKEKTLQEDLVRQQGEKLVDDSQLQQDAVSLGQKKTYKPNDEQKRRNARIDKAQKETGLKKATADTKRLHDIINADDITLLGTEDEQLYLLRSTEFKPRMLTSSNIRAHFAEYMQLIKYYRHLDELAAKDQRLKERLDSIKENMEILIQRMDVFCSKNRLHLDGSYMKDDEKEKEFHVDRKQLMEGTVFKAPAEDDYTPEEHMDVNKTRLAALMRDEEKRDAAFAELSKTMPAYHSYAHMSAKERIENIAMLRGDVILVSRQIEEHKRVSADKNAAPEERAAAADMVFQLKKDRLELMACLNLAEAEARVVLAEGKATPQEMEDLKKKAKAAYIDYRAIRMRRHKERLPMISSAGGPELMSRGKALSSESDKKNYRFKKSVQKAAEGLTDPNFATLKKLAAEYAQTSHYVQGNDTEAGMLKTLLLLVNSVESRIPKDGPAMAELKPLKDLLLSLNASSLPDWKNIPQEYRLDFMGKSLQEKGSIHDKGAIRNWFMTNSAACVWEDKSDEPLFAHEPTINDLRQGKISNCYMLATVTKLIQYDPQAIKQVIRDNGDGSATVRLYNGDKPMFIRVDKKVAHLRSGGAIASEGPLWMQLIELAAAQVGMFKKGRQGFGSLWYGTGGSFFQMLTGVPETGKLMTADKAGGSDTYGMGVNGADGVFERIRDAEKNREIIHMGTKSSVGAGMNSGHAYTVLGAKEVDGKKYVTLRNPYANMSYRVNEVGEAEKSTSYFSSVADETCGQFDMPLEEFIRSADSVAYTKLPGALFPGGTTAQSLAAYKKELEDKAKKLDEEFLDLDAIQKELGDGPALDIDTEDFGTIPMMSMKQEAKKEGE
ncbi:MAG: hypothetical protein IK115_03520 [Lachnospiraceae bacterium]|nr:hypothetical protein [Lachnospiraceae bacterium]